MLGSWVEVNAFDREMAEVHERHLLIARNITLALERYVEDTSAVLDLFASSVDQGVMPDGLTELGRRMGYVYFCSLDRDAGVADHVVMDSTRRAAMTPELDALLWSLAATDGVHFSGVMPDVDGIPTIFVVKRIGAGKLVMGALSTAYQLALQRNVAFGDKGHAAIVDQFGHIIAHPNPDWVATSKDISAVAPVAAMMAGKTGVMTFFSPAVQKDMVTGFSVVPQTGWGVMVPQPVDELARNAHQARLMAFVLALGGLVVAGLLSWLLAGLLMRPVRDVIAAAGRVAGGDLGARAPQPSRFAPAEMRTLADRFNHMAAEIEEDRRALAAALAEARIADRAKAEFMANVSHELRTPLNAIIGFSELIETQPYGDFGDPRYAGYISNIKSSGRHLRDMINDILDLSAAQSVEAEPDLAPTDVAEVIASALQIIGAQAEASRIDVVAEVAPDLGSVPTNARRLLQILLNLLSNAVKFTQAGGTVRVEAQRDEAAREAVIVVSDNGIGMASEEIPLALAPFGQLESSLTRRFEGTGLGLPLAKAFTERLGGNLTVESNKGVGTTVTIRLPLD